MSPDKPTREDATGEHDPKRLYEREAGESKIARGHAPEKGEGREARGGQSGNAKHAPHVTANDREADQHADSPALPANASGEDKVSTTEADQPIRESSMYDQRRDQDKDRPPSTRQ